MDSNAILLEEPSFLVLNKPAGLLTQAAPGVPSVQTELTRLLADRQAGVQPFVGLPHRLDRGTTGTLLVARNERSLKRFGLQFQSRKVEKRYWAVCEGEFASPTGTWVDFMRKIPERPVAEIVAADHPEARQAILHYQVVASEAGLTWIEVQLETGRMHQIRLQAASRGYPVVGDWCYGAASRWGIADPEGRWQQFALHARSITFRHPLTGIPVLVEAPVNDPWFQFPARLVELLRSRMGSSTMDSRE